MLYRHYCAVCHGATGEGDGPNASYLEDDRPRDLTDARYVGRLTDEHLVTVIGGGGGAAGRSRFMPAWGSTFEAQQVGDLVAYTRSLSRAAPRTAPASADPKVVAGKRLVADLGCAGCHRIGDLSVQPVAPDLSQAGSKLQPAWIQGFLQRPHPIRPAGYVPLSKSRMPDFRLSAEESRWLAAYLVRLRSEQAVAPRAPPSTTAADAAALFQRLACRACHHFEGRGGQAGPDLSTAGQRLQPDWIARYLLDPQRVDPRSPMPRPGIAPDEAWGLANYLSRSAAVPPSTATPASDDAAAQGAGLFRELACGACHRRLDEEPPERVGPDLTFLGDRLRPEWLAGFLRQPHPVRPWLRARMPTFGLTGTEIEQVTAFLTTLRDPGLPGLPPRLQGEASLAADAIRAGARLASREYFSCSSCHLGGDRPPDGSPDEWAPDLGLAGRRLRPEWVVRWLLDPQRLLPGTKMPSFFADADSGPADILEGDRERQILALRDYLLALGAP